MNDSLKDILIEKLIDFDKIDKMNYLISIKNILHYCYHYNDYNKIIIIK